MVKNIQNWMMDGMSPLEIIKKDIEKQKIKAIEILAAKSLAAFSFTVNSAYYSCKAKK